MTPEELKALAQPLLADLETILRLCEKRKDKTPTGKWHESPLNRMTWNQLSVEASVAIRHVARKASITLPPKTEALVMDSLQSSYRQAKSSPDTYLCVSPSRPEITGQYRASSCQVIWLCNAVKAAVAIIDEATEQSSPSLGV